VKLPAHCPVSVRSDVNVHGRAGTGYPVHGSSFDDQSTVNKSVTVHCVYGKNRSCPGDTDEPLYQILVQIHLQQLLYRNWRNTTTGLPCMWENKPASDCLVSACNISANISVKGKRIVIFGRIGSGHHGSVSDH